MESEFTMQFCQLENDISGSPTAELDADTVNIFHELGDFIISLEPQGFGSWTEWVVIRAEETFGQGQEYWIGKEFNSPDHAMAEVEHFAEVCNY